MTSSNRPLGSRLFGCVCLLWLTVACQQPPPGKPAVGAKASATTTTAAAAASKPAAEPPEVQTLPNARPFEREVATFRTASETWVFHPTDNGYTVDDEHGKHRYRVTIEKRTFSLAPFAGTKTAPLLRIRWQPLGFGLLRAEGAPFMSMRITGKGWEVHAAGKKKIGTYQGPIMGLQSGAATARADPGMNNGVTTVRAKVAAKPEVVHEGHLAPREVVLTLLPGLSLVEASLVSLFFAEERW